MRYAQINSKYVCGIDLHAREMYACVMNDKGEILFIVICIQTLTNSKKDLANSPLGRTVSGYVK